MALKLVAVPSPLQSPGLALELTLGVTGGRGGAGKGSSVACRLGWAPFWDSL